VAAGKDDFRAAVAALDGHDIGAESVADIVVLGHHAFAGGHDAFKFAEVDDHIGFFKTADGARDDLAGPVLELLINHLPLDLAEALVDRLAGGLGGDAAEIAWCHLDFHLFAIYHIGLDVAGLGDRDFIMGIIQFLAGDELRDGANSAIFRVDIDPKIPGARGKVFLRGREDSGGYGVDQNIALDALFTLQQVQHSDEFRIHKSLGSGMCWRVDFPTAALFRNRKLWGVGQHRSSGKGR
jgi:hypothetical protein